MDPPRKEIDVTIANAATVSGLLDMGGYEITHLRFPSAFTGATVTFESTNDSGTTWLDVNGPSVTVVASDYVPLTTDANSRGTEGLRFVRLKSASAEGAARTVGVVLKRL